MKEEIVLQLPISLDATVAVLRGVGDAYPNAKAITDHRHGLDVLVIEVDSEDRVSMKETA